jgi:hypothetical protein
MRRKGQHCLARDRDPSTQDNLLAYYKPRELKKLLDEEWAAQPQRRLIHDRRGEKCCSEDWADTE